MTETAKRRTITVTGRAPVTIIEDAWPIIAEAITDHWHASSGIRRDAGQTTTISLRVRQHADGRAIVYGVWEHETRWQGEKDRTERAGELLAVDADLVAAITRVGASLRSQSGDEVVEQTIRECIADLPAEEI